MHLEDEDLVHASCHLPKGAGIPRKLGYSFQYDSKHPIVMHFVHCNCLGGSRSGGVELMEPGRGGAFDSFQSRALGGVVRETFLFCSLLKELAIIDAS